MKEPQTADDYELEKLLLVLRDGRKFTGVLRSWDQFGGFWRR
jgi:small nuclear ribonucleoprotein (snRNP)-like protein